MFQRTMTTLAYLASLGNYSDLLSLSNINSRQMSCTCKIAICPLQRSHINKLNLQCFKEQINSGKANNDMYNNHHAFDSEGMLTIMSTLIIPISYQLSNQSPLIVHYDYSDSTLFIHTLAFYL